MHQEILLHVLHVPVFLLIKGGERLLYSALDAAIDHFQRFPFELLPTFKGKGTTGIDHLALLIHHIVVLEQPFTRLEVLQFDAFLRLLD